ncbi:hypothetical protein NC652_000206 [Populus alba x Populus x berolinensis]|nr:hypothetical protein NC652_000206 [Populus alba x Populus x berolinensis]
MEIGEEEVKREATEPEKHEAVLALGLRNRREPIKHLMGIGKVPLHAGLRLGKVSRRWSDIKHMFPELLASANNQTVPEFPREDQPESSSWNDQPLQGLIGNENLMEKSPYLASRNTQQPLPELQANDNRLENLDPSVFSQDDSKIDLISMNDNGVNQHVVSNVEAEQQLLDAGESSRHRVRTMETTFMRIGEIFLTALFTTNYFLMGRNPGPASMAAPLAPLSSMVAAKLISSSTKVAANFFSSSTMVATKVKELSRWTLLMTNFILEIASAVFDQMGYALIGMVLAFVALLLAAVELIHMALKERIIWAGKRPILPYTSAATKPVGTIVEYFGLAGAAWQCVYSTVEYTYTRQEKDNPIKMCLLPSIFLLCVVISKLLVDKRSIDESS